MREGLLSLLCLLLLFNVAVAVDRSNFKTCSQSSFCQRHRDGSQSESPFKVERVVSLQSDSVSLEISSAANPAPLSLKISVHSGPIFRFTINEINPLYPRFEVPYVIEKLPQQMKFTVEEETNERIVLSYGARDKIVIVRSPLSIAVLQDGKLIVQLNKDSLLKFEHYRKKEGSEVTDEDNEDEEEENGNEEVQSGPEEPSAKRAKPSDDNNEKGMWEETFKSHHDSKPRGPASVGMDIAFPGFTYLYGLPEHADAYNLKTTKNNGDPYRLYNLDVFEYELDSRMATYGAIPMVMAHNAQRSVGVFWLNAAETWVDVDRPQDRKPLMSKLASLVSSSGQDELVSTQWISESGIIDVYVMVGPSSKDVMSQYASLTGLAPLPPMFAIAYHQCRWNYNDDGDCRAVDANFDTHDIPYDVLWLDIEHTQDKKYFTWDGRKFPDSKQLLDDLNAKGRKMVTIVDPHIKRVSPFSVHDQATQLGHYVKKADGSTDYNGHCWPGDSSWVDYLKPAARDWWAGLFSFDHYQGSAANLFTWNDMNEPSVFSGPEITMHKDALHHGGVEHRDVHNIYGMLMVMATNQGQLQRSGNTIRPFVLSRAFFAGSQRLGAVWTGDNMATWEHMRVSIPMLLSLNTAGYSFVGADVGGFFGNPAPDLLVRWYQLAAFTPFFRAHAHIETKRREPWLFGEENTRLIRDAIRRRYALLPYWYTQFFKHSVSGIPIMRPYLLEFPTEEAHFGREDAFLVGPSLLVAPVLHEGASSVSVALPGGPSVWYDYTTYERHEGPATVNMQVNMDSVPVFTRGGSIIPLKSRIRRASPLARHDPLTLIVSPDNTQTAEGDLYMDDEHSFNYRKGEFIYRKFSFKSGKLTSETASEISESNSSLKFPVHGNQKFDTKCWLEKIVILSVDRAPKGATLELGSGDGVSLDVIYDAGSQSVTVRKPGVNIRENFVLQLVF